MLLLFAIARNGLAYVNLIDHCGAINEEEMLKHGVLDLLIAI